MPWSDHRNNTAQHTSANAALTSLQVPLHHWQAMAPITRKRLEGVAATPNLWSVYDECLTIFQKAESKPLLTSVSTEDSVTSPPSDTTPQKALLNPLSLEEAHAIITEFQEEQKKKRKRSKVMPISLIRSMKVVLQQSNNNDTLTTQKLEEALGKTTLQFTPPPQPTAKSVKFQERMKLLRLQNEESKYHKITKNIAGVNIKDDEVTTKSMTYAASVGLNMIVAPISFGVFMFFFSGPVLGFLWSNYDAPRHPGAVDIRKVIIGVISGVAMLFIEMLLFVIRTHELERVMDKKQKKKKNRGQSVVKPFGEYTAASSKTFTRKED